MESISFCDKVKQFFKNLTVKESCISSCCNTIIEEKEHTHKHKHKHKDIEIKNKKNIV
jgi:hypothetical protein